MHRMVSHPDNMRKNSKQGGEGSAAVTLFATDYKLVGEFLLTEWLQKESRTLSSCEISIWFQKWFLRCHTEDGEIWFWFLYKVQAHNLANGCSNRKKLKISITLRKNTYKKLELIINWEPLCVFIIIYVFISNLAIYFIYLLVTVSIYFTECCLCVKNDPVSDRSPNTKDEYLSSLNVRRFSSPDRCVSISIARLAYPFMFIINTCCMFRPFRPQPDWTDRAWSYNGTQVSMKSKCFYI